MRDVAEAFVRESFYRTYHATIRTFMPTLLVLTDASGAMHGAVGCRAAADEDLFLERWLSRPIEELLEERGGPPAPRADILELGDFACRDSSAARRLITLLPFFLLEHEHRWVTFIAAAGERRSLRNVGAQCIELGAAEGACVRHPAARRGHSTRDPRVMAGYLPLALEIPALRDGAHESEMS
jgi:hypothetical protein